MKNVISIILLISLAVNTAGSIFIFKALQSSIRKDIKREIISKIDLTYLEVISLPKGKTKQIRSGVQWIHSREFKFKGKMYDIASFTIRDSTIDYLVFNDTEEELLIDNFLVHPQNRDNFSSNPKLSLLKLFIYDGYIKNFNLTLFSNFKILKFIQHQICIITGYGISLLKPPNF